MSTVDRARTRIAESIDPKGRRMGSPVWLNAAIAGIGVIVVALCLLLVSPRFGQDKPHQDEDVPDQRGSDETGPGENIPRQR